MLQVEYTIPPNDHSGSRPHVKKAYIPMKRGGYLIYATAHMHIGGVGATLYGQVIYIHHLPTCLHSVDDCSS